MSTLVENRFCHAILIAAVFLQIVCGMAAQEAVKPKRMEHAGFEAIGIEARTNNTQESGGNGAIPKQWQRLFMEGVLNRIPDRVDQSIVAVYTTYAGDWNGDYTYILGAKVKPGTKALEGTIAKNVSAGKYVEFVSKRGRPELVVPEMWKEVWTYFQIPGNPSRAYDADYEIYDDMSDPTNVQVRLYVGVKP